MRLKKWIGHELIVFIFHILTYPDIQDGRNNERNFFFLRKKNKKKKKVEWKKLILIN